MTIWEQSSDLAGTIRALLREPSAFFRTVEPEGRLAPGLAFGTLAGSIGSVLTILWQLAASTSGMIPSDSPFGAAAGLVGAAIACALAPLGVLFGILVGGAANHLGLILVGGARHGLGATLQVASYAQAPQVLAVIPICGAVVGTGWTLVLSMIGLREVHGISTLRATAAVLLPLVLCVCAVGAALLVALRTFNVH